ncbi:MAG: DNA polymerase I [Parasporobacterium sp.]|nr:DNA polymerase I [Parasporobacterium sp.]
MSDKLLLVDGYSIVSRAFYGIRDLTNSEGLHTNAIYGFLNIFFSIYAKQQPDHILVAFDVKQKTFRHDMFPDYKGTRKPMPSELLEQVPVLKEVLKAMKIRTFELAGYEADDILGTYARIAEEKGLDTVILSGDRDLLQLATKKVMICLPKTKSGVTEYEEYYDQDVLDRYQVTPEEFIELKALMGDTSDNIPGIPGIGEKTATAIITQYHSLEEAISHASEIKPKKASENLQAFAEQGRMSKVLATINVHTPVTLEIEEMEVPSESVFYNSESFELFKKLELNRLLNRFDLSEVPASASVSYEVRSAEDFDPEQISEELSGLYLNDTGTLLGICNQDKVALYTCSGEQIDFFRSRILKFLGSGRDIAVFSLKQMLHTLNAGDFAAESLYDTEIMAYLLNPLQSSYSYDLVSKDYLGQVVPSRQELIGKRPESEALSEEDTRQKAFMLAAYSAQCAAASFRILQQKLEDEEMWDLFLNVEMPLVYALYHMEREGVQVNRERLKEFSQVLAKTEEELKEEIFREAGEQFNLNSPIQLGTVLFEKLGLPASKKTKKGYSTSAEVLEKLAPEYPVVDKILQYRQVTKLRSTYADGLANFISEDGRIHGTFNQTITATGRISSTEPNLQNIPIRTELGQEIRRAFTAKEGCIFLDADYSQIELRLLAHMSGDKNLIEAYNTEADIHRITASKVFHIPYEEVTKEQRRNAKAVNFGIVYGISSFGLSQDLSISRKQASEYIKQYFETYPGIKTFLDETVRRAKLNGYVTSMFGRRRPIPELSSGNFMQRSFGERAAMNSPLQGSAADIMKIAMINVEKALKQQGLRSRIVLQIHDELLVETLLEEKEAVREILSREMKNAAHLEVTLEVDVEEGRDWYEAH